MSGWIAVKRGLTQHPIFHKRPDRAFVWLWLLETAAYKDTRQDAGGRPIEVKRGQVLTSLRQIEAATGVGIQVIRTLLDIMRSDHAINTDTSSGRLLVTICNYDKYQSSDSDGNAPPNTLLTRRQHTKETNKQIPTTSDAPASPDPVKVLFDAGVTVLASGGINAKQARSMVGLWRKEFGDEAVIVALGRAQREGAVDPASFVMGCLKAARARKTEPEIGEIRDFNGKRKQYAGNGTGWLVVHD